MKYNTQLTKLVLPEYGRNIQNMVNHCLTIEDRDERKRCAQSVINVMGGMFPHLRDVNDFKHILWDHLAIMSGFKLDIDYPYEIIKEEELNTPPGKVEYSRPTMKYRHYGKIMERLIKIAADMEVGGKRDHLVKMLVAQMKRTYIQWNKDVDDAKIYMDLFDISEKKIDLTQSEYSIPDVKVAPTTRKLKNIKGQRRR